MPLLADLLRNLILILAPVLTIQKLQIERGAILPRKLETITQNFGTIKNPPLIQMVEHLGKFALTQRHSVVALQLLLEIGT